MNLSFQRYVSKPLNNSIHKSRDNVSHCRENLRRSVCILLSRILSTLSKTAFSVDTAKFANYLHQGLVELPKDSTEWSDAVISYKKNGSAFIILLYYHFLGTREYEKNLHFSTLLLISLKYYNFCITLQKRRSILDIVNC